MTVGRVAQLTTASGVDSVGALRPAKPARGVDVILLNCPECGLPMAKLVGGALVIQSRHHGEKHTAIVAVSDLVRLAGMERGPTDH